MQGERTTARAGGVAAGGTLLAGGAVMAATKEKDLIPLVVDAPLATTERDGVHITPLAAVLEGKHLVVMLKATLPPRGKRHAEPKTRTLRLTDPWECTGFVREILPQAK